jgi:hypothetical protein
MLAVVATLALSRTFHLSPRNFASGGLTKNDHIGTLTTNFYNSVVPGRNFNVGGESIGEDPTEWFSTTPYAIMLVDHDGNYSEWKTRDGGLPGGSTQFTVPPYYECSISMAHLGSRDLDEDQTTFHPPKSAFDLSTTTFMIENDLELGEQSFYVNAPSYLEYYLPACPNWTPEDCDGGSCGSGDSADCPKRQMHAGEFKLTVVGLMSGTDVNSLATGDDAPAGATTAETPCPHADGSPCEDEIDRDIAQYKELVYAPRPSVIPNPALPHLYLCVSAIALVALLCSSQVSHDARRWLDGQGCCAVDLERRRLRDEPEQRAA